MRRKQTLVLDNITWRARRGEQWVVLGPNGSGKSSLAAVITAHLWPSEGVTRVLGETYGRVNLSEFRRRLAIFQPDQVRSLDVHHPALTAFDLLAAAHDGSLAAYREFSEAARARASELLREIFTDEKGRPMVPPDRPVRLLSSGERRKLLLLRLLVGRPELLLLDEPYESLDIPSRVALEKLLATFMRENPAAHTITIVHRIDEVPAFATHALLLKNGGVFQSGPVDEALTSENLSRLYGVKLRVGREHGRFFWVVA